MCASERLEQIIEHVGDLPAVPETVSEVLLLTENSELDLSAVAHVIEKDPALSAKILRVSNSPYYGMRQYVGTLKLALVILGVREVRNIVLGISVFDALRSRRTESMLAGDLWKHSFEVAAFAKKLGDHLQLGLHGEEFITGLLHDIGKLVLMRQYEDEYAKIYSAAEGGNATLCTAEVERFGFSHAEAAAALAARWNFPQTLTDGLLLHHPNAAIALREARDPCLAAVVRIANLAARQRAADDAEAWALVSEKMPNMGEGERDALLAGFAEEIASASAPSL